MTSLHLKPRIQISIILSIGVFIVVLLALSLFTVVDVMAAPPQAPSDVSAWLSSDKNKKIVLSWSASPGATQYYVYRNSSSGFIPYGTLLGGSNTVFIDPDRNLVEGTRYSYQVIAFSPSGLSPPSEVVSIIPYTPITADNIWYALISSIGIVGGIIAIVIVIVRRVRGRPYKKNNRDVSTTDPEERELIAKLNQSTDPEVKKDAGKLISIQAADELEEGREKKKGKKELIKKELRLWKFWNIIRGEDWFPSLSLFQFFLWTVVILFSFLFLTFIRQEHNILPPISGLSSPTIIALLGISVASPLVSSALSTIKYPINSTFEPPYPLPGLGTMLEEGGKPSFTRFQMFAWTFISIITFFGSMYVMISTNLNSASQLTLPNVDPILLALMGISQAAYIGGKAYSRTPGITSIYPRVISQQDLGRDPSGQLISIFGKGFGSEDNNLKSGTIWIGKVYFEWPVPTPENANGKILIWEDDKIDLKIKSLDVGSYVVRVAAPDALFRAKEHFIILSEKAKAAFDE